MFVFQRGFSLIEMIVVMLLTSLLGVWGASAWVQQSEDVASASMGVWLLSLTEGVDQMLIRQADVLTGILAPAHNTPTYANIWQPTLSELRAAGHLASGFPLQAPLAYDVSVSVLAPVGACLTVGCKIEALVFAIPKERDAQASSHINRIGKVLEALPGRGASVTTLSPLRIRGATIDLPNTPFEGKGLLPVGAIVLQSFYDATASAAFLRQADQRDVHLKANLRVEGKISSGGHLQIGSVANPGEACESQGLIAQSSATGLLVCQGGVWQNAVKQEGGFFVMNNYGDCKDHDRWSVASLNPRTDECGCPKGFRPQLMARFHYPYTFSESEYTSYLCAPH